VRRFDRLLVVVEPDDRRGRILLRGHLVAQRVATILRLRGRRADADERWGELLGEAGFTGFRRATETPFNRVFEVRP
jgi:hypothetical protein